MKRYWQILIKILHIKPVFAVLAVIISAAALIYVFTTGSEQSVFAYVTYVFSAYSFTVIILQLIPAVKQLKNTLNNNAFFCRYRTDIDFKTSVSVYISLIVTSFYCVTKAAAGIYYRSAWLGSIAFYYILLCILRFILFRYVQKGKKDPLQAYRRYRFCGCLLFVLTVALGAISFHTIHRGKVNEYPWFMIYAAAGYTFYNLTMTIINLIRYRKAENPIYSAAKALSLASGLVSAYFLQASMLSVFGNGENLQTILNYTTSAGIFLFIVCMAIFMIVKSTRTINTHINKNKP